MIPHFLEYTRVCCIPEIGRLGDDVDDDDDDDYDHRRSFTGVGGSGLPHFGLGAGDGPPLYKYTSTPRAWSPHFSYR